MMFSWAREVVIGATSCWSGKAIKSIINKGSMFAFLATFYLFREINEMSYNEKEKFIFLKTSPERFEVRKKNCKRFA